MFEFEKRILKEENRYPGITYPYQVVPLTEKAKLAFAKWNSGNPHRVIPKDEVKDVIKKHLDTNKDPLIGKVLVFEDAQHPELEVIRIATKKMALAGVPGIAYASQNDSFKRHYFDPLEIGKDFEIKVGKGVKDEPPVKLTFADIKAL